MGRLGDDGLVWLVVCVCRGRLERPVRNVEQIRGI